MQIQYLTEELPPDEVVAGFERSGANLSIAEGFDGSNALPESFEAVLYDAATLGSSDDNDLHQLRDERRRSP